MCHVTATKCHVTIPFHEVNAVLGLHVENSLWLSQLEHLIKQTMSQQKVWRDPGKVELTNFIPPKVSSSTRSTARSSCDGMTQRGASPFFLAYHSSRLVKQKYLVLKFLGPFFLPWDLFTRNLHIHRFKSPITGWGTFSGHGLPFPEYHVLQRTGHTSSWIRYCR